ncbi:hypothetical protein [Streptomyces sp. 351MFTsu5.1]|uniref:hypothetical protein n=1 Tax=Streptomyces sp. 351MFTsu5.1 TaxID=1172180 RepID=UPI001319D1D1|nr:hypothetical protein [Streptomyces sp. 351MFTsu5.1]
MSLLADTPTAPAACVTPDLTAEWLMAAPLEVLLVDLGVELFDSKITDRTFFGAVVQYADGRLSLSMPVGRSEFEHDTVARYLLAQAFGVGLPPLPEPFETTEF